MHVKHLIPSEFPKESVQFVVDRLRGRIAARREDLRAAKSIGLVRLADIRQLQAEIRKLRALERAWLEVL